MLDMTYQDIMKRYPTIDTNTAKRIILFTHDILGKDKGDNRIVKYDICRLTMTGRINEDGYHELTVKKIKEYLSHLVEMRRYDRFITGVVKGIYNNIQCSDDGIWHLHCVIVIKIKQDKWKDIEKEKRENRNKIKDYYYRVVGRVEGYHGRKIEECVKVGMHHVHITIDHPRYPDQRWYTTIVDDRNNLIDYIGYQCQENELMKAYRKMNKHKQLSTTHVYKDILMD